MNSFHSIFLMTFCLAVASGQTNAWLNVHDFGASGSKFETSAATAAGSKQIAVKNAGDFKVGEILAIGNGDQSL